MNALRGNGAKSPRLAALLSHLTGVDRGFVGLIASERSNQPLAAVMSGREWKLQLGDQNKRIFNVTDPNPATH